MSIDLWKQEYTRKGIPSSFRVDPTKVVVQFLSFLQTKNLTGNKAADIGCGKGRNSFYLAEQGFSVTSLEWVKENVEEINMKAKALELPIKAFAQSVMQSWPISFSSLDIAIDIFCYKHIVDKEKQADYRKELAKALKPDGYFFLSLAADDDGFYGPLLKDSSHPAIKFILDPFSKIPSVLYNTEDIIQEFSDFFTVIDVRNDKSTSPMYGKEYERSVLNLIFQKNSSC